MPKYRDPVPEDRTIVPGIWSDFMDRILSAMEISNRNDSGLGVFIQGQTTKPLSLPFVTNRVPFTLAQNAVVNSRTITAVAGHGIVVGDVIELSDSGYFLVCKALIVAGNVITLDQPVNYPYTTDEEAVKASDNLLVDGSVTPVIFSLKPNLVQAGDITSVNFELIDDLPMDFLTFGGVPALTNGVVIRINNGNGNYFNLFNVKSNGDIIEQSVSHNFLIPRTGVTEYGFASRVVWAGQENHGVVIRLDGSLNESLEIVIQDNLTAGNIKFQVRGQGSEIQN